MRSLPELGGLALQPLLAGLQVIAAPCRRPPMPLRDAQPHTPAPDTSRAQMDIKLRALQDRAQEWVHTSIEERQAMLRQCLRGAMEHMNALAEDAVRAKGSYGNGLGEEMLSICVVVLALEEYIASLSHNGQRKPVKLYKRDNGQYVAQVFPTGFKALLFGGHVGEVWIDPNEKPTQGALYRNKADGVYVEGAVSLVLGAGNQTSVAMLDILDKLIQRDEVVLLKLNPVNDYLGPHLAKMFAPLVKQGFLDFAYGGAQVGEYLCQHELISSIHLTGSRNTFNSIVWGAPTFQPGSSPKIDKPFTAELGNVTPYILTPGAWKASDIEFHVDQIVNGLVNNASHNCIALELLVIESDWSQRSSFMESLRKKLAAVPQRKAFYPGSQAKYDAFLKRFPESEQFGVSGNDTLPWCLAADISPEDAETTCEHWCGVVQEVRLSCNGDASLFLESAVEFANEKCDGSLCCSLFIDPKTQREHCDAYQEALQNLRYGSITVNCPSVAGYGIPALTWGAFPGNTKLNIESGTGAVHNTFMFDHPQKSIMYAPWRCHPKPLWASTNNNLELVVPWACELAASQNFLKKLFCLSMCAFYALQT